ncbi:DUF5082 family protein [Peribacillus sp. SCS-26]|uniref:YwqH-like family protein n=1 Tax=Paraperibacillus marinus TaxID=3115295 RepID=UPI00390676F7
MLEYYYALLSKKQNDIIRLQSLNSSLQNNLHEFQSNEPKSMKPELSPRTWFGKHGDEFDVIRSTKIRDPYLDIIGTQFPRIFSAIAAKIAELEAEIASIRSTIAALEAAEAAERAASSKMK